MDDTDKKLLWDIGLMMDSKAYTSVAMKLAQYISTETKYKDPEFSDIMGTLSTQLKDIAMTGRRINE